MINGDGRRHRLIKFAVAASVAWTMIYADQQFGNVASAVRDGISQWLVKPVRTVAQLPASAWQTTSVYFQTRAELIKTSRELEEKLLREQAKLQRLDYIEHENIKLREILDARREVAPAAIVTEVVNTSSLPFVNRIVLSKGRNHGIQDNQGVFNADGVIGQLARIDAETSQVLLLTDRRFWIATRVRRNGLLVLLQGDGGRRMRARFVPADAEITDGDVLITAGGDGPYPPGMPVARVAVLWQPSGEPFMQVLAEPLASIRQDSTLLVHAQPEDPALEPLPIVSPSALPANFTPDVLP